MYRNLWLLLVLAGMLIPMGCTSDDDDDTPPPPAPFGPSAIAVGDDALIILTGDFVGWVQVTAATSGITATDDIEKVVRVPGHPARRLVVIVNDSSAIDDHNAEIWYNDNGGAGAWTKAWYGTSATDESYLDAEHQAGGAYDDWDLNDIFFVDQYEGYAVGDEYVILRTFDGGATWYDGNAYQDGTGTIAFQMLDAVAPIHADFQVGVTIEGDGGTPGQGVVYAIDEDLGRLWVYVTVVFTAADNNINVVGLTNTEAIAAPTNALWELETEDLYAVWANVDAAGVHTIWTGGDYWNDIPGVWDCVTDAPALIQNRAFTWRGPERDQQDGTGEIGENDVDGLFFFPDGTGLAGTDDGVWHTSDAGVTWAQYANTATDDFYNFAYSAPTLAQNGYLYSVNGYSNNPGRVAVTYATGTPGTWTLDATNGWVEHGDSTMVGIDWIEGSASLILYGAKLFVGDAGYWTDGDVGYCLDATLATFDTTIWTDTSEMYLGGTAANGSNPLYNHYPTAAIATAETWNSFCER